MHYTNINKAGKREQIIASVEQEPRERFISPSFTEMEISPEISATYTPTEYNSRNTCEHMYMNYFACFCIKRVRTRTFTTTWRTNYTHTLSHAQNAPHKKGRRTILLHERSRARAESPLMIALLGRAPVNRVLYVHHTNQEVHQETVKHSAVQRIHI